MHRTARFSGAKCPRWGKLTSNHCPPIGAILCCVLLQMDAGSMGALASTCCGKRRLGPWTVQWEQKPYTLTWCVCHLGIIGLNWALMLERTHLCVWKYVLELFVCAKRITDCMQVWKYNRLYEGKLRPLPEAKTLSLVHFFFSKYKGQLTHQHNFITHVSSPVSQHTLCSTGFWWLLGAQLQSMSRNVRCSD